VIAEAAMLVALGGDPMRPWTDDEVTALHDAIAPLGIDPRHVVHVMCNESGCDPSALNRGGGAAGLIQIMPANQRSMGWAQGSDVFVKLSIVEQMPFVARYFGWFAKPIVDAGNTLAAVYAATFLPVGIAHSGDPDFMLCGAQGPYVFAYAPNKSFDAAHKGYITIGDVVTAAERAFAASSVGQAIVARLDALYPVAPTPEA
jgi:Transglycosylase SLT domain